MSIRVSFMGVLAGVTREKEMTLSCGPEVTLRQVLDLAEQKYGEVFGQRVYRNSNPPRRLQTYTRIFVNGNLVDDGALDKPLGPAEAAQGSSSAEVLVYVMPAASGG